VAERKDSFEAVEGDWQGQPIIVLRDKESEAEAHIVPGIGANCVGWSVTKNGQSYEVIEHPRTPPELKSNKFKAGIPVLWPFPGRVRNARYNFEDQEYHLPITDKGGIHHIHGIVINAAWRVKDRGASDEGAFVELVIEPDDLAEDMRSGYPFDFLLTLRQTLSGSTLIYDLQVDNRSADKALPFGYGLHPYFQAPLAVTEKVPDRTHLDVHIPAAKRWPAEGGLPGGAPEPLQPQDDFQQWRPLGSNPFDHMYGEIKFDGEYSVAGFRDSGVGLEVLVKADRQFHDWVLFTQPNRPSLCIEPYTCPPNAINFKEEGLDDSHLLILQPGGKWQGRVVFEVTDF
jgi:aldose 1-epimerase